MNTAFHRQSRTCTLWYRERDGNTWHEINSVNALRYHVSEDEGLRLSFTCERFSRLRLGQIVAEALIFDRHEFSTDIAFAPNVAFEYAPDQTTDGTQVFARIHPSAPPMLELPFKATASFERGLVRYTAKLGVEAAFVTSVTNGRLRLDSPNIRRFDAAASSDADAAPPLGRPAAPASRLEPTPLTAKPETWFQRCVDTFRTRSK